MNQTTCEFTKYYKTIVPILLSLTTVLSPALNILVCITILGTRKLHSTGNVLIFNLAVSDAMIASLLGPLEIRYIVDFPKWPLKAAGTYVLNSAWLFSLVSPFVIVSVITVERYRTIKSFTITPRELTRQFVVCTSGCIWLYSIIAVAVMTGNFTTPKGDAYEWNVPYSLYYPFLAVHIAVPLLLVSVLYHRIYRLSKRTSPATTDAENSTTSQVATLVSKRELKLAKTLGFVIGLLFIVWLPVLVIELFYGLLSHSCQIEAAGPVSVWLSASNGVMNPLIYFYRNPVMRNQAKKVLKCKQYRYQIHM